MLRFSFSTNFVASTSIIAVAVMEAVGSFYMN